MGPGAMRSSVLVHLSIGGRRNAGFMKTGSVLVLKMWYKAVSKSAEMFFLKNKGLTLMLEA